MYVYFYLTHGNKDNDGLIDASQLLSCLTLFTTKIHIFFMPVTESVTVTVLTLCSLLTPSALTFWAFSHFLTSRGFLTAYSGTYRHDMRDVWLSSTLCILHSAMLLSREPAHQPNSTSKDCLWWQVECDWYISIQIQLLLTNVVWQCPFNNTCTAFC